jgi:hypothetical protein
MNPSVHPTESGEMELPGLDWFTLINQQGEPTMDVYCGNCGEPSDIYHVNHDMDKESRKLFLAGIGCDCCHGKPVKNCPERQLAADASSALFDLLGPDELDGIAGMMDDFGI